MAEPGWNWVVKLIAEWQVRSTYDIKKGELGDAYMTGLGCLLLGKEAKLMLE